MYMNGQAKHKTWDKTERWRPMLLTGPFPTPSSTPRAPLSPIPIDNAVIRVACHRCITNQTGQRLRQKGPLSEHPSYGLHVSGAGPFSLSPARPSSLFLATSMETESRRRTKAAPWNRLNQQTVSWHTPILKKEHGTFQISFVSSLPSPTVLFCIFLPLPNHGMPLSRRAWQQGVCRSDHPGSPGPG